MTIQEAKQLLKYHSFQDEDIHHPKMVKGFLGMLRPFTGQLYEENYHEVMNAIKALSNHLRSDQIEKEVMASIWGICHLTRSWAIHPNGMLQRNALITDQQVELLIEWIEDISYTTFCILDGCDDETSFSFYKAKDSK